MSARQDRAAIWEDVWVPTACDMCYNVCTVQVHRVNGVAVKVEGIPEAPPNYGRVCAKGNAGLMNLYNPHRILKPLLRTNPQKGIGVDPRWKEVSWDEAMDLLVEKLRGARAKDPRSLVAATFDRCSYFPLRAFMAAFGSPNATNTSAGFFCGNGVHPVAFTLTGSNDVHPDLRYCNYLMIFGSSHGFVAQINLMIGAVDVPGGLINSAAAGPNWLPKEGPDGLLVPGNPFTNTHLAPVPPRKVKPPESLELVELFPVSVYARSLLWLGVLHPEKFGLTYGPEVFIQCRTNLMATSGDPEVMAEALKRVPFMVSFADQHNETTEFADLLLPDSHALERLVPVVFNPYIHYNNAPLPGDEWCFNFQQPVVKPRGQARYWMEVLLEAAERLDILPDVYRAFNAAAHLEAPYRLDPSRKYTWEEICDRWLKSYCGGDHGLDYFREHGYCKLGKRTAEQSYPRLSHKGRIPLYLEHFIDAGEDVRKFTEEHNIPWDTSDYIPLTEWRPCPAQKESPVEYDLFVVNHKVPFLTLSITSENSWLMELAHCNAKVFPVGLNAATGKRKGIAEGDEIEIETPSGKKVRAVARLTEGIHPECLAVPAILGRWVTSNDRARGKGVHFNSLLEYTVDRLDTLSAALDACVKVKVRKVGGSSRSG